MRLFAVAVVLLLPLPAWQPPGRAPLVPIGVRYDGGRSPAADFAIIKSLGFNSVSLRGTGRADADDALSSLARNAGLHVFVQADGVAPAVELSAGGNSADVRLRGWEAISRGARAIFFSSWSAPAGAALVDDEGAMTPRARAAGEFAGIVSRNASLFFALRPRAGDRSQVRVDGAPDGVEGRFLDSNVATLLIAINHADRAQKVTLRFPPDTPEAIWQNLETGAAVSFIMGQEGPYLTHSFLARDVVVLVRARRLQ